MVSMNRRIGESTGFAFAIRSERRRVLPNPAGNTAPFAKAGDLPRFAASKSCPSGLLALSSLALHVFPKCPIDPRLIAFFGRGLRLEPSDHVGVYAQGQLLLHWPVEKSAF